VTLYCPLLLTQSSFYVNHQRLFSFLTAFDTKTYLVVGIKHRNMVITPIPVVQSKRRITTGGEIVGISIRQSEPFAARVYTIIGNEGPLAGVLAFDPGDVVFGAFEGAGGEFGCTGYDCGEGVLGEGKAEDGEGGGEFHGCLGWEVGCCLVVVLAELML
jgi:hypothetical protein